MFCPSCNAPNREDAKFCKGCGHALQVKQAEAPEQVSASAPAAPIRPASPAPASEEGVQPMATTSPSGPEQVPEPPAPANGQDDPALAPTLILSPEKVLAYRSRFWTQEQEADLQSAPADASSGSEGTPAHPADQPTLIIPPGGEQAAVPAGAPNYELADQPTLLRTDMPAPEQSERGAAPSFDKEPAATLEESAEQKEASSDMTNQPASDETPGEEAGQTASAPADETSRDENAPLVVGETVIGRYEITQVLNASPEVRTYQVVDREGYQHCWNCGSEQNAEGDEFCIDCGASMLNAPYVLHEYPASANPASEINMFQGAIVNTFMDRGHTYAVEQPAVNQSPFPNGVQLLVASNSDAGNVRRADPNEDSTLVVQLQRVHESISSPAGVFIVADGLGGHDNGQVASRMAVNVIAERVTRELLGAPLQAEREGTEVKALDEDDLVGLLRNTIEEANVALCQRNQRDKTDMGSTLTGYMIVGEHAYIVNVGDSRTYMVRGGQIYQLTTDHSLVGQLVAGGLIEPDDVYTHPQRSQIFRSLGDKPNVQVDVFKQQLLPGDILLSCSDGLWEMIRNPQIEDILNNAPDPQTACSRLIDAANTNGGEDNVSAVVAFVR